MPSTRSDRPRSGRLRGWNLDLGGVYVLAPGRRATRRGSRPSGTPSAPDGHFFGASRRSCPQPDGAMVLPDERIDGYARRPRQPTHGRGAECSDFQDDEAGAGEGNRTLVFSLEGCCSTIELHPHSNRLNTPAARAEEVAGDRTAGTLLLPGTGETGPALLRAHRDDGWWRGLDLNQRRQSQRIYSPSPLTTRAPLHNDARHRGPSCRSRKASSRTGDAGKPQRPKVTQSLNSNRHPRPGLCENTVPKSTGNRRLPRQRPRPCGRLGRTHRINPSRNAHPHRDAPCAGRPRLTKPRHV